MGGAKAVGRLALARRDEYVVARYRTLEEPLSSENPLVEGLERLPVRPTALVTFGGTGDLAHRKLLPALCNLAHDGALPERFRLVGVLGWNASGGDDLFAGDALPGRPASAPLLPQSTETR